MSKNTNKINTNSDTYTILYSIVVVIVVAFLLAFVFKALKPTQDLNVALDKKKQILYSLNIRGLSDREAAAKYKEVIVADKVISPDGKTIAEGTQGGEENGFKLTSADMAEGKLPIYVCQINGETKYVIPMYGMGLWGSISGYIAINADKNTVYGAYFNHESETAGLGAEIKDNLEWQQKFSGKKIFGQDHSDILLSVEKKVSDPDKQVDGITGATLTSNGVKNMLHEGLSLYMNFLKASK